MKNAERIVLVLLVLVAASLLARRRPGPSPALRNDFARADSAAAAADTIIVAPESLVVSLRDTLPTLGLLRTRALDAHGAELAGFLPLMRIDSTALVQFRHNQLVPLVPGRTRIIVTPLKFSPGVRASRAVTYVPVVVRAH